MKKVSQQKIVWPHIVAAYSTDLYPASRFKGSPLQNVGLEFELPEFNSDQILYLARQYGLESWQEPQASELRMHFGGHPAQVQQALYTVRRLCHLT